MNEVNGLAHTMYSLECLINQNKLCDWEDQPEDIKNEWCEHAEAARRITAGRRYQIKDSVQVEE